MNKLAPRLRGIKDPKLRSQKLTSVITMLQENHIHLERAYDLKREEVTILMEKLHSEFAPHGSIITSTLDIFSVLPG